MSNSHYDDIAQYVYAVWRVKPTKKKKNELVMTGKKETNAFNTNNSTKAMLNDHNEWLLPIRMPSTDDDLLTSCI